MNSNNSYYEPTYEDVLKASDILKDVANKTVIMTSRKLNSLIIPSGNV